MIRRIDQYLLVNRLMVSAVDPFSVGDKHRQKYMLKFLEIVTTVSSVLLVKSGTKENLQKKKDLWTYISKENPNIYRALRSRLLGRAIHLPGRLGKFVLLCGYTVSRKIFGFN